MTILQALLDCLIAMGLPVALTVAMLRSYPPLLIELPSAKPSPPPPWPGENEYLQQAERLVTEAEGLSGRYLELPLKGSTLTLEVDYPWLPIAPRYWVCRTPQSLTAVNGGFYWTYRETVAAVVEILRDEESKALRAEAQRAGLKIPA